MGPVRQELDTDAVHKSGQVQKASLSHQVMSLSSIYQYLTLLRMLALLSTRNVNLIFYDDEETEKWKKIKTINEQR